MRCRGRARQLRGRWRLRWLGRSCGGWGLVRGIWLWRGKGFCYGEGKGRKGLRRVPVFLGDGEG